VLRKEVIMVRNWDPFALVPRRMWQWPTLVDEDWVTDNEGMSVYETDEEVVVKAHVSGVPADKVDVSVEGGTITIKAEYKESEEEKKKKKVVYRESKEARYLYTASLPSPVKANQASADVKDGVVTVSLPKKEEARPQKIMVKTQEK